MGANSSKNRIGRRSTSSSSGLSEDEASAIASMVTPTSPSDPPPVTPELLTNLWEPLLTEGLVRLYARHLFGTERAGAGNITFKKFAGTYAYLAKGTNANVALTIVAMTSPSRQESTTLEGITTYLRELWGSYVKLLAYYRNKSLRDWANVNASNTSEDVSRFVGFLLQDLESSDGQVSVSDVESWLFRCPVHNYLMTTVVKAMYNVQLPKKSESLFPVTVAPHSFTTFLGLCDVAFLNWALNGGSDLSLSSADPWRLLFSTRTHGESWATFFKSLLAQGPTLIVVQDPEGATFGFYASQSWECKSTFYGDQNCFLFMLRPEIVKFEPTGYNANYQYLNSGQTTLPNGLGTGGQFGYWGLFLDSEFSVGRVSKTCSTFRKYAPLSRSETFRIAHLEVWATGKPDLTPEELGERVSRKGALNSDPTAEAFLEMAGKTIYSRGLRPEDTAEDEPDLDGSENTI